MGRDSLSGAGAAGAVSRSRLAPLLQVASAAFPRS